MNTNEIRNWINNNNLLDKTFQGFWICMNNYIQEELHEFEELFGAYNKERVKVSFDKYALKMFTSDCIEENLENREFMETHLRIEYSGKNIGYYKMLFDFNGESFDDVLAWEWKEWFIHQRLEVLKDLKTELHSKKTIGIDKGNKNINEIIDKMIEKTIEKIRY